MVAVVLRGPANTAPDSIVGPFAALADAEEWALAHPRNGGYCVAQEMASAEDVDPPG